MTTAASYSAPGGLSLIRPYLPDPPPTPTEEKSPLSLMTQCFIGLFPRDGVEEVERWDRMWRRVDYKRHQSSSVGVIRSLEPV